ncbi:hypothetical protein IAG41_12940 [Sphingomonas sp. JC676]|uniref:hypothetical protein n=1 Tax=Sphingomonas sp. JC676 TaxID=2768065 RepID=UPI0016583A8C|nr:hypothetical protein [Sphingomonas sp. JC676]MBC9033298.1 hypothetical protein [Sphingomonas sp. JC676]
MDINYLLEREQISLMRASAARSVEARIAHEGLARGYARLRRVAFPTTVSPGVALR